MDKVAQQLSEELKGYGYTALVEESTQTFVADVVKPLFENRDEIQSVRTEEEFRYEEFDSDAGSIKDFLLRREKDFLLRREYVNMDVELADELDRRKPIPFIVQIQ